MWLRRRQCFGRSTAGSRALAWRRVCAWLRVNGKERRATMLAAYLVHGPGNSGLLPTHANMRVGVNVRSGLCRAVGMGRSRQYLARTLSGAWCRWHPSRTNNGSFVVGALNNFQGGLYQVPGAYKRTSTTYGHAGAPCAPLSPTLPAGARRRFRQKNGASTKKALFHPSSAPSGVATTTRIILTEKNKI